MFKAHVELNMQLKREEDFWRQKAGYEWFKDGERNTKSFHTIVKGRRSRLRINRIQNEQGEWMEDVQDIADTTVNFFQDQFTKQQNAEDFSMMNYQSLGQKIRIRTL